MQNRKQIEQEEGYEYCPDTPYRNNSFQSHTPRRGPRMMHLWSSSHYIQSSFKQQRSIFTRQSQQLINNSSKNTKVHQNVAAFDELLNEKEYSFRQQRILPTFGNQQVVLQQKDDDENFYQTLNEIQQNMITLDKTIEELESKMSDIKIQQLSFINKNEESYEKFQQKYVQNHSQQFKLFNLKSDIKEEQIIEFGKPDDFEKLQIVYIQQNISGFVGKLSHLLQNQSGTKTPFRTTELEEGGDISFTFNKSLNRFTKVYHCKFCPQKFQKACSLGGHISRTHKAESQQSKRDALPIRKTSITKQRKSALQKAIGQSLMKQQ